MIETIRIRARVRALANVAFAQVAPLWPIGGFVAVNPLGGYEGRPFAEATAAAAAQTGARGLLPEDWYRKRYAGGGIRHAALDAALDAALRGAPASERALFGRTVTASDLVRCSFAHDLGGGIAPPAAATRVLAVDRVDAARGTTLSAALDDRTIAWCAAFTDEGEAAWSMPYRERGFFAAWHALARFDTSRAARPIAHALRALENDPPTPEEVIARALERLGIASDAWAAYLTAHALRLPGWAGFAKWRAAHPEHPAQRAAPIDPVAFLAVRLWYEAAFVAAELGTAPIPDATLPAPALPRVPDFRRIASALGAPPAAADDFTADDRAWMTAVLAGFDDDRRCAIWLAAHERDVRGALLDAIVARAPRAEVDAAADIVFCIDTRSEGLRRHLEPRGAYRTRGFAGFFGLPIAVRGFESTWDQPACPVLLTPRNVIAEEPADSVERVRAHRRGRAFLSGLAGTLGALKANVAAAFVLFEALGAFFAVPLLARTFAPALFGGLRTRFTSLLAPPVRTAFRLDKVPDAARAEGFSQADALVAAESALALMAMRDGFPPLVVLVGHGSTNDNNPYEAALDCGACAGHRGGPNARVLAALLNRPAIRADLAVRGIAIPDATHFVGAEHDTATDTVTIADRETIPAALHATLAQLERDLAGAGRALAAERLRALAPHGAARTGASVLARSRDWAQIRPEWGLARNAAFVIAPRAFTAGADLAARTFLHEYDVARDVDGALLEIVMTAPLIVAQWINHQYYFSSVDNAYYGSGTKVVHTVVGRIGVMAGNRSDLRCGLPLQSVADGDGLYHDPVRLLALVVAPRSRIDAVIARNEILRRLFHGAWIALAAFDPETASYWEYTTDGAWIPYPVLAKERP